MICKKCGREYEDDMLKCLWCDAPNDHHVAPDPPSRQDLSEVLDVQARIDSVITRQMERASIETDTSEETEKKIAKHPAGNFMWCAAILGAVGLISAIVGASLIAFFHRKEIRKNLALTKFTSAYISSVTAQFFILNGLAKITMDAISMHLHGEVATTLTKAVTYGQGVIFLFLCGYTGAFIIKKITPDYKPTEYKEASVCATVSSIPAVILLSILTYYLFYT